MRRKALLVRVMKWFGEPWPSAELRAPVCEDDAERMAVPIGETCERCQRLIAATDRGVTIPFLTGGLNWEGVLVQEIYYHAKCFLAVVVGDAMAAQLTRGY